MSKQYSSLFRDLSDEDAWDAANKYVKLTRGKNYSPEVCLKIAEKLVAEALGVIQLNGHHRFTNELNNK